MTLLKSIDKKNYIGGCWFEYNKQINIYNPSNQKKIGSIPKINNELLIQAINSTVETFEIWSKTSIEHRSEILKTWYSLIIENIDELSDILTLEQGKILEDSRKEIVYGSNFLKWFAENTNLLKGTIRTGRTVDYKIITEWDPIGPVAAITPWNFPSAMVIRKIAPALMAGCTIILKPSELTPFSALALAKLSEKAGLPSGVLNVITGQPKNIGKAICEESRIRKLSFTGSTKVGKLLYKSSSISVKSLCMELGGNAPYIIFEDIEIENVVSDLIKIKIRSSGQSCTAPNRIFIQESIYKKFTEILIKEFSKLTMGDGFNKKSNIGPMINRKAVHKIHKLLEDSEKKGAKIICGGKSFNNFFEPTVIIDCKDNMEIFSTEIFGPVLACYEFNSEDEVIKRANNTEYGLQAYIYSKNISRAQNISNLLNFSMISINDSMPSLNITATFSGRKNSGFGIETGDYAIFEYLNTKYINFKY